MSKVYFTSDLHFGHEKLCRGLWGMSAEESDNLIISNWNKTISKRDTVYLLGDITMEKPQLIKEYVAQLNGTIVVVAGNHDTRACCQVLRGMKIDVVGNIRYKGFILSHVPLHDVEVKHTRGNLHGHIHRSGEIEGLGLYNPKRLSAKYYNVNCEFHDYCPILFEYIQADFKERNKSLVSKLMFYLK